MQIYMYENLHATAAVAAQLRLSSSTISLDHHTSAARLASVCKGGTYYSYSLPAGFRILGHLCIIYCKNSYLGIQRLGHRPNYIQYILIYIYIYNIYIYIYIILRQFGVYMQLRFCCLWGQGPSSEELSEVPPELKNSKHERSTVHIIQLRHASTQPGMKQ